MKTNNRIGLCFLFLAITIFTFAGCGGDGSSSKDPSDDNTTPAGQVSIYNQTPSYRSVFTTSASPVTISGMGSGPIDTVTWENLTTGESGNGTGTTSWTVVVPLKEGDNEVRIVASPMMVSKAVAEGSITVALTVTYNTSVNFTSLVQLTPDTGLVGESYDAVYVRVGIDAENLDADSVELYKVDASGEKDGAALAVLTDDGNLANGDEIQGDGIYSAKIAIAPAEATPIDMRIFASDTLGTPSKTALITFKVFSQPTEEQLTQQAENNEAATAKFDELISSKISSLELSESAAAVASIDEMVAYLITLDGIVDAGPGAYGVWWLNDTGMFCVLSSTPNAGEEEESYAPDRNREARVEPPSYTEQPDSMGYDEKSTRVEFLRPVKPSSANRELTDDDDEKYKIGSLSAIHIMPFKHTISWYKTKYPGGWYSIVEASECPAFTTTDKINELQDPMTDASTEPVPLSVWKSLSNYGLISSATHGDSLNVVKTSLENKYPELKQIDWLFPWHNQRPILHANIAVDWTLEALSPYLADILAGRIMLSPSSGNKAKLVMTPEFISYYNGTFPNTVWINISCRGAWTDALGAAFIAKGGGAWYGYTDYVKASYAHYTEEEILWQLIKEDKNVKEAFDEAVDLFGDDDNDSDPAALTLLGEHKTRIGVSEIKNGSFEEPEGAGSLSGWIKDGDGRAIKILGGDSPTEGGTMAVISSGLGFTTGYGTISQSFCLPEDAQDLHFDWNFYSEEFKEFCHRGYDDTFLVELTDIQAGATTQLFRTSVDTLCGACLGSDLESDACQNLPLISSPLSFDRGGVWHTGWTLNESADISAYQGKAVILKFYIEDKGDTIYDTAVLLDNIRITPES